MRAISNRLCSMSATALSYKTLSGCLVSFVIGFSYFLRRKPQEVSKPASNNTTKMYRAIIISYKLNLNFEQRGFASRPLHFHKSRSWVGGVKNGRPCYQPVTPG